MLTLSYCFAIIFILFLLIYCSVLYYYKYIFQYWKKKNIFYIEPEFFYGSFEHSQKPKLRLAEIMREWYNQFKNKGHKFLGAYHFLKPILVILDPEMVKNVLQTDFKYFSARYAYGNIKNDTLSQHFLNLHGEKWKLIRHTISPMTTNLKVKSMFQIFLESSLGLENCLDKSIQSQTPIDVRKISSLYSADSILSFAFGIKTNSFQDPSKSFHIFAEMFFQKGDSQFNRFLIKFFPELARKLSIKLTNKNTEIFFKNLVKELVAFREENNVHRNDILQMMINLKNSKDFLDKNLSLDEITAQLFGIFLAGYESSSGAISNCLYELSRNLDIQEQVRDEITAILKRYNGEITYEGISEMKFLERVVLETLRKHPTLDYLARRVTEDYKIPGTDTVLEKGIGIYIPIIALHFDPDIYPSPQVFDPDRFLEEAIQKRPPCSYLAFSEGPRICTGKKMGLVQTKVGLVRLLKNYKFVPNQKTRDPLILKTRPVPRLVDGGIWLSAKRI